MSVRSARCSLVVTLKKDTMAFSSNTVQSKFAEFLDKTLECASRVSLLLDARAGLAHRVMSAKVWWDAF